jgi:hypothetical protein
MKDRRVEKLVDELKVTVERLNRINAILARNGTTFYLNRSTRDGDFTLSDIEQRIEYK